MVTVFSKFISNLTKLCNFFHSFKIYTFAAEMIFPCCSFQMVVIFYSMFIIKIEWIQKYVAYLSTLFGIEKFIKKLIFHQFPLGKSIEFEKIKSNLYYFNFLFIDLKNELQSSILFYHFKFYNNFFTNANVSTLNFK